MLNRAQSICVELGW